VTVGPSPVGVAITPDGAFAYVTNAGSDTVSVIDTATNTVTTTVTVGSGPGGVAITPDGAFAYATNVNSGNVSVIDTASNTVTTTVPVGSYPIGVAITPDAAADPGALLQQLRDDATGKGPGTSLADKIALAQTYFAVPDIQATCAVLDAFINQVNVLLRGKKPRGATAQLITDANAIKTAIGCL
jgi:YVTN family beta-propeller protein